MPKSAAPRQPRTRIDKGAAAASPEATTATPTPSEELVRQASQEEIVTAANGMKVTMKKPGVLAQYRLAEAMGPELAANSTWMQMVQPFIYVAAINGDPVFMPNSKLEMEALITRLDEDGMAAAMAWYIINVVGPTNDIMNKAEADAKAKARLKN